jgi:hypothetical protein
MHTATILFAIPVQAKHTHTHTHTHTRFLVFLVFALKKSDFYYRRHRLPRRNADSQTPIVEIIILQTALRLAD